MTKAYEELFAGINLPYSYKLKTEHNPIMVQRYSADPWAIEYNGRVYVYSTNDLIEYDENGGYKQNGYGTIYTLNVTSTEDMVNWTDHGVIQVGTEDGVAPWIWNSWAPAVAVKNIDGKDQFFVYFSNSGNGVGVIQGESPTGPWSDPIGKSLVDRSTPGGTDVPAPFDPAVLVDDDGKAYLYYGGGTIDNNSEHPMSARVIQLGDDMVSVVGEAKLIDAPWFFEDSGINKIGDKYYYSYCSNWENAAFGAAEIIVMESENPMGPFETVGSIFQNPGKFGFGYSNNHHILTKVKGNWYLFYHTTLLEKRQAVTGGYRSVHVDEAVVDETTGQITEIFGTEDGVHQVEYLNPFKRIEAETMAWSARISTKKLAIPSEAFGEMNMAAVADEPGAWIGLSGVDFGAEGAVRFTASIASEKGGVIKICSENQNGDALGYLEVTPTGSDDTFQEFSVELDAITGVHDLFFVCSDAMSIDYWQFS